ncbi:MAG: hypothetical protein WA728_08835 [Xanthobacteraceae bacterium]
MVGEQKTRSLGTIPVSKLSRLPEWKDYVEAAKAFSAAKNNAQKAKTAMKDVLKRGSSELRDIEGLEFNYVDGNKEIYVYEQLQQPSRTRGKEIAFGG